MDDRDIDKMIVSNKVSYKKTYKYFISYRYVLRFHKWMCMQEDLVKINVCLFYRRC